MSYRSPHWSTTSNPLAFLSFHAFYSYSKFIWKYHTRAYIKSIVSGLYGWDSCYTSRGSSCWIQKRQAAPNIRHSKSSLIQWTTASSSLSFFRGNLWLVKACSYFFNDVHGWAISVLLSVAWWILMQLCGCWELISMHVHVCTRSGIQIFYSCNHSDYRVDQSLPT